MVGDVPDCNYYPGYFYRLHDELAFKAATGFTDGQNISRFSFRDYMAISSIQELLEMNLLMPLRRLGGLLWEGRLFKVLALFLLGIWAGRQILDRNILSNAALLKKAMRWGLAIGLPLNLLRTWVEFSDLNGDLWPLAEFVLNAFALTPLAMAYCAVVAIIVTRRPQWLGWFAPVGRTALSNYLFQSLICIFIFTA